MNLGLISLICLLAAIVIGFVKNCNVGILCTGIAAVLALVFLGLLNTPLSMLVNAMWNLMLRLTGFVELLWGY